MQGVEHLQTVRRTDPRQIVRLAWLVVLVAFGLFCSAMTTSGYLFWSYRTNATVEQNATLIVREPTPLEWANWKRKDRTAFEQPLARDITVSEGDRVRINSQAGYGQAASMRLFDQSRLDLWAGADLVLEELQTSQWNDQVQRVVLRQKGGYVRYDLRGDQPYRQVFYQVRVGETLVDLAPGGSYSIEVLPQEPERRILVATGEALALLRADIAVRSGRAEVQGSVHTVILTAGQRVEVDPVGTPSLPVPARWELIRDGNFNRYTEEEYNNTTASDTSNLLRASTWEVSGQRVDPRATPNGFFQLAKSCPPPDPTLDCDPREWRNVANFIRAGGETKPFITSVSQTLGVNRQGVDISEYRSLVFSAWVRVLHQSVPLTGERGSECPVMLRFTGKKNNPADPRQQSVLCIYSSSDPTLEPVESPEITYQRVEPYTWYHVELQLRDENWLPDFKYLESIQIDANGHDYNSHVTGISLIGSHFAPDDENLP
jgi:hypothetical protein